MTVPQSDQTPQPASPCPHCGVLGTPIVTPGTGPHAFRETCAHCGTFLRWRSKYGHEDRVHRREQFRRAAMGRLLPTPRQLVHLQLLGYVGEMPADRQAASDLIDIWRTKRGLA